MITDLECCAAFAGSMGSTAVTAVLLADEDKQRTLYTSNVGDR